MKNNSRAVIRVFRAVTSIVALAVVLGFNLTGVGGAVLKYTAFLALTLFAGYSFETLGTKLPVIYTAYCVSLTLAFSVFLSYVLPSSQSGDKGFVWALSAVLFAPIFEELFFRGALISFSSIPLTCIASSVVFAAFHGADSFFQALLMGLVFSYFYISSKNIAVSIICHMVNNALALVCMRYDVRIPVLAVSLIAAVLIYKIGVKNEKKIL